MKNTLMIAAIALATTTAFAQTALAQIDVRIPANYLTPQIPAKGQSYTDAAYPQGSSITRLTDAKNTPNADNGGNLTWIEDEYSTAAAFSTDNSHLILLHQSYFGLYTGAGAFVASLPLEINSSSEPRWSRSNNDVLIYHSVNALKSYNVVTKETKTVHTFSEYTTISGNGEMDLSYDGDHMVFSGDGRYIFLYTFSTDSKSKVLDTTGHSFDAIYVTPDNHVTVTWNQNGIGTRYTGIEMFDSNMNYLKQIAHAGGHMHMGRDINGQEVLIWTNSNDPAPACGSNAIVKVTLATAAQTCLVSLDWSLAVHISAADNDWAFVETYNPVDIVPPTGWAAYTNELLQIKLDGSEVRRLAQHRSRPLNSYTYMPKLTASRDGSILIYSSNFGTPYSDEYMMSLTAASAKTTQAANNGGATVVNGASYQQTVAPGAIVSLFGDNLAGTTQALTGATLPSSTPDVTVYFNNIPAPLFYVSPKQINAQVPYGLGNGNVTVTVKRANSAASSTVQVNAAAPGIFTTTQSGTGMGAILRADDNQQVTINHPATRGSYISIYCTGLGQLNAPIQEGTLAPAAADSTVVTPQVTVGGSNATVTYAGIAPGFVGLYQVNVQLPTNVQTGGAVPLTITANGVTSNTVTVAIN